MNKLVYKWIDQQKDWRISKVMNAPLLHFLILTQFKIPIYCKASEPIFLSSFKNLPIYRFLPL